MADPQHDQQQPEEKSPPPPPLEGGQHSPRKQREPSRDHRQQADQKQPRPLLGWSITVGSILAAILVTAIAVHHSVVNPRTDDAEVFANYIGMAPQVDGPISHLAVHDNQYVRAGELLFEVDDRPYRYSLDRALSEQAALEGQIVDRNRMIASQQSAVHVAAANVSGSQSGRDATAAAISEAEANIANALAAVSRAEADRQYAENTLHRLEPLLAQQYVTIDQVDQARTLLETRSRAVDQAHAQLALDRARLVSSGSRFAQSDAEVAQRRAQQAQASNAVETIEPLSKQREARSAAVRLAQYNLNNCKVYAPFDARVTNLTLSEGAYVHTGSQVFTLIDSRVWWVIANFRETQLRHVYPGVSADVFLMAQDNQALHGTVESIGFGVTPDPSVNGVLAPGLPAVQRSLSWVHLAARYPVRIRIEAPPPDLLRIGQTAVAVLHDPVVAAH
jgi:multidrug efflux system membrane fusion protein